MLEVFGQEKLARRGEREVRKNGPLERDVQDSETTGYLVDCKLKSSTKMRRTFRAGCRRGRACKQKKKARMC
jgi:hypothetical protein